MTSVDVTVPKGMNPAAFRRALNQIAASSAASARIAAVMEQQDVETGPATAAQLAAVEHLWRHLISHYGAYGAADIARMRGAKPTNRSIATNLAKSHGLIGFPRGNAKVYPAFEFKGSEPHPQWPAVSRPLIEAGWDGQDILLWMVSPHPALDGREPAALIDRAEVGALIRLVETEARGVW
ncbi:MAG TPA: hypothetical protein VIU11_04235 [Nakamurella sp.]